MVPSGFGIFFGFLLTARVGNAEMIEIVTPETTSTTTAAPKPPPTFQRPSGDSYLQAYMSLSGKKVPVGLTHFLRSPNRRDGGSYNTIIRSSHIPQNRYPSLTHRGHWMGFRRPLPRYGYPPHGYYNDYDDFPPSSWENRPYSSPSSGLFSLLFSKKFSLNLVLTIVLKLILFTMLVKFIAVICLLLFIPAVKSKESNSDFDDEMRKLKRLDAVSELVWNGIEGRNTTHDQEEDVDTDDTMEMDSDTEDESEVEEKPEGEESDEDEKPDVEVGNHGGHEYDKEDYSYEEEELKDIKKIVDLLNKEPNHGPYRFVRTLRLCITAIEIVVNIIRTIVKRHNDNQESNWARSWMTNMNSFYGGNFASETKTGRSRVRDTISVTGTSTSTGSRTNTGTSTVTNTPTSTNTSIGTSTVTNTPTSTSTSIGTSTVTNTPTSTSTSIGTSTVTSPSTTIGLTGTGPQSIEPIPRSLPSGPETELSTESSEINTTTTASENEKVPSTESNSNGIEEDKTKESKSDYLKLKLNDFRFLFFIPEIENGNSIVPENPKELILPVKRDFLIRFRKPEVRIVNSQCPDRCDPSFLVSGTCHPCIMIR